MLFRSGSFLGVLTFMLSAPKYENVIFLREAVFNNVEVEPSAVVVKRINSDTYLPSVFLGSGDPTLNQLVEIKDYGNVLKKEIYIHARLDRQDNLIEIKAITNHPRLSNKINEYIQRDIQDRSNSVLKGKTTTLKERKIFLEKKIQFLLNKHHKSNLLDRKDFLEIANLEESIFEIENTFTYPNFIDTNTYFSSNKVVGKSISEMIVKLIIFIFISLFFATVLIFYKNYRVNQLLYKKI